MDCVESLLYLFRKYCDHGMKTSLGQLNKHKRKIINALEDVWINDCSVLFCLESFYGQCSIGLLNNLYEAIATLASALLCAWLPTSFQMLVF